MYFFFFFKQKKAYEMRISDWSSDVCSSDLIQMKIVRLEFALDLRSKFARTASPEGFLSDFMLFREGQIGPVDPINRGRIFQCCRRHEGDIPRRECKIGREHV